jgi:hypothetical protein
VFRERSLSGCRYGSENNRYGNGRYHAGGKTAVTPVATIYVVHYEICESESSEANLTLSEIGGHGFDVAEARNIEVQRPVPIGDHVDKMMVNQDIVALVTASAQGLAC